MVAEHITNMPSGKHSGVRARTLMLVVHSAETPLAAGYAASVTQNWLNRADVGASINTFFGPDTTVRSVNTNCAAWHATWANGLSVGYEFTGYAALSRAQWLTEAGRAMLDRAGREMAADAKIYGIPLRRLSTAEVNQIAAGNTTIKGLATHAQIDPVNRTDPGTGFPYDVLMENIKRYSGVSTWGGNVTPTTANKEDELSASAEKNILAGIASMESGIRKNLNDHFLYGTNSSKGWMPGATDMVRENQRRIEAARAQIAALTEAVNQLAKNKGVAIDYAKIEAIVEKSLADGVEITGTIQAKK